MGRYTIDDEQRQRLTQAQRAETGALHAVTLAKRRRERLQARVDAADAELGEAHRSLVEVSGFQRAVLLSGEPPAELRRLLRYKTAAKPEPTGATGQEPGDE